MVELFAAPYITEPNIQSVSWYYILGEMVLFEGYYISVLLENMARNRGVQDQNTNPPNTNRTFTEFGTFIPTTPKLVSILSQFGKNWHTVPPQTIFHHIWRKSMLAWK